MSDQRRDPVPDGLSGIQLQLDDLYGVPGYDLRPEGSPAPPPINPDGWLGLPDPELYPPSTEQLTAAQLKAERAKGNVLSLAELQKLPWRKRAEWLEKQQRVVERVQQRLPALSQPRPAAAASRPTFDTPYKLNMLSFLLSKPNPGRPDDEPPLWKDPAAMMRVVTDWMQHHCWVQVGDGVVSLWNLFHFVERNPEMRALLSRRLTGFDTDAQRAATPVERLMRAVPWQQQASSHQLQLPADMAAQLPHGLLATGEVWGRRPTKWLWGLDGVRDLGYALYVHEDFAEVVMRGKWGGLPVDRVMGEQEYWRDMVEHGADMGMTVMAAAARDLPLEAQCRAWGDRVAATLKLYQPKDEAAASSSLQELAAIFNPRHLAEETKLMTEDGAHLRAGARLLFNTDTDGRVIVQAVSPGTLREQESYLLGVVQDPALCRALLATFLDPTAGAEPRFAATAAHKLLFYVNGFRTHNRDANPHQRRIGAPPEHFEAEVVRASSNLFRLPRVGQAPCPTVVSTVADRTAWVAMERAVSAAVEAAQKVPSTATDVQQRRQRAAEVVLSRALVPLGIPEHLLEGAFVPEVPDVGSEAEPLEIAA